MRLFFIQGGSRLKRDTDGNWYTDSNFNNDVWDRYKALCDELVVVLRREEQVCDPDYAKNHFSPVDETGMRLVDVPDLYSPVENFFNLGLRRQVRDAIDEAVDTCDKAIIRSAGNFYVTYAGERCRRAGKPYLSEVTGFIYEGLVEHGALGKLKAYPSEKAAKKLFAGASYASYVTTEALQERYPCSGRTEACSDVEIQAIAEGLADRRKPVDYETGISLGTTASLDVAWKGHSVATDALSRLNARGLENITYFSAYLEWLQHSTGHDVDCVLFRDKGRWGYEYSNMRAFDKEEPFQPKTSGNQIQPVYSEGVETDPYLRAFFGDLSDRQSCYQCRFKKRYRVTDLTLWDCFDAWRYGDGFDDNRGATRILVHSDKGQTLLEASLGMLRVKELDADEAASHSRELTHSVDPSPSRTAMFADLGVMDGSKFVKKWFPMDAMVAAKRGARELLERTGAYSAAKKTLQRLRGR